MVSTREIPDSVHNTWSVHSVQCSGLVVSARRKGKKRVELRMNDGTKTVELIPIEFLARGKTAKYLASLIGGCSITIDWDSSLTKDEAESFARRVKESFEKSLLEKLSRACADRDHAQETL